MRNRATVAAVAKRQHQLITRWQLRLLDVSDRVVADRVASREWARVAPGVIALGGTMPHLRRLAATVLSMAAPEGAALRVEEAVEGGASRVEAIVFAAVSVAPRVCGRSALWLHGLAPAPAKHWLRVPRKAAGSFARDGIVVRYGAPTGEVCWLEGLPAVDVAQALMDVAGAREHPSALWLHHDLVKLIATAHARRSLTLESLHDRVAGAGRFVGAPLLRRVLADLRGELVHSGTERKARRLVAQVLERHRLQLHPAPFLVVAGRERIGEADLAVLALCLDFEVDGPHHLLPEQQAEDRKRDRKMRRAGWEVERFPTNLIDLSPQRFVAQVEECVQDRLHRFRRESPAPAQEIRG